MKLNKYSLVVIAGLALVACNDINELEPQGGSFTAEQQTAAIGLVPERADAAFAGMFSMMGQPYYVYGTRQSRADDFGFIMAAISQDAEGPDLCFPNSGYNWLSPANQLTSRNPDYANPYIRYSVCYSLIKSANDVITAYGSDKEKWSEKAVNQIAQSRALRAFAYMQLAPEFQFGYAAGAQDKPCVPIVLPTTPDPANNPRATVAEVYDQIFEDLNFAVANLAGAKRTSKMYIDQSVAYGLRARANLATEHWKEAAEDAEEAAKPYQAATIEEVSTPSFYNINDKNWMWGYDMTTDMAAGEYGTAPSWIGSFSLNSYSDGTGCYATINKLLYDKISPTDVRKGWWVDADLNSPLLETVDWNGLSGKDLALLEIENVKMAFLPYTNVKFGAPQIPTEMNDSDWPLMRVEEMLLIQAEGWAKAGDPVKARGILEKFVSENRDRNYKIPTNRSLVDEIWFQRRVELWGEGFAWSDMMRLNKPLVRFHDNTRTDSNYPEAFRFNLPAGDPWMLMRFPTAEMNTNAGVINNTGGQQPVQDINGELRDGVTD